MTTIIESIFLFCDNCESDIDPNLDPNNFDHVDNCNNSYCEKLIKRFMEKKESIVYFTINVEINSNCTFCDNYLLTCQKLVPDDYYGLESNLYYDDNVKSWYLNYWDTLWYDINYYKKKLMYYENGYGSIYESNQKIFLEHLTKGFKVEFGCGDLDKKVITKLLKKIKEKSLYLKKTKIDGLYIVKTYNPMIKKALK